MERSDEKESAASRARLALFHYGEEILFRRKKRLWLRVVGLIGLIASVLGIIAVFSPDGRVPDAYRSWVLAATVIGTGWFLIWNVVEPTGYLVMENLRMADELSRTRERDVFGQIAADVYGLHRPMFRESCEVENDGAAKAHTSIEVQATTARVWKLEHYVDSGTTGGNPQANVAVEVLSIDYPGGSADYVEERASRHTNVWSLVLSPALPKNKSIKYHFIESLPPGTFVMDGDRLLGNRRPYEWASREIIYPTKHLYMEVVFPRRWTPVDRAFEVWCARGGIAHGHEKARIDCNPESFFDGQRDDGRYFIALDVPDPVLGLRYALTWKPPGAGVTAVKSAEPSADEAQ